MGNKRIFRSGAARVAQVMAATRLRPCGMARRGSAHATWVVVAASVATAGLGASWMVSGSRSHGLRGLAVQLFGV